MVRGGGGEGRPPRDGPRRRRRSQRSRGETTGDNHSVVGEAITAVLELPPPVLPVLELPPLRSLRISHGQPHARLPPWVAISAPPLLRLAADTCCSRVRLPFAFEERWSAYLHLLFPRKIICLRIYTSCWRRNQEGIVPGGFLPPAVGLNLIIRAPKSPSCTNAHTTTCRNS